MTTFTIRPLPAGEVDTHPPRSRQVVADGPSPCRRCLRNAEIGDALVLAPYNPFTLERRRNGHVQALVTDDGPGVPEHQREQIFERFVRLDPTKPGHGLGLAIARRIAHQHDGDLTCEVTPIGASFTLRVPAER